MALLPPASSTRASPITLNLAADLSAMGDALVLLAGGKVERVGEQQQGDDRVQHRPGKVLPHVRRQAVPRDPPDARADDLDADHQRRREQHRPEQAVTELRAGLRIRGDAARVVVGGAGDQPRPELFQQRNVAALVVVFPRYDSDTPSSAPTPYVTPAAAQPITICRAAENQGPRPLNSAVTTPINGRGPWFSA